MRGAGNILTWIMCLFAAFAVGQEKDQRFAAVDSLLDKEKPEQALKLALQLTDTYYKDAEAWLSLAYCYIDLKEDPKCMAAIDKALELDPQQDTKYTLYYLKADCYSRMLATEQAQSWCEKFLKYRPNDGYGLNLRGWLYFLEYRYDKAIPLFEKALQDTSLNDSDKAYSLSMLGSCYLQQQNPYKAQYYDSLALQADNNHYDARLLEANIRYAEKKYDAALQLYKSLLARDTSDKTFLYDIASCYFYLKDYDRAIAGFKTHLQHSPEDGDANNRIAWALFLQKKYLEGLPYANKAVIQDPANSDVYDTRGFILYKKGDYVAAIADFDRALKLDKKNTNACYFRALCFIKIGRKEEACKDLEKAAEDKDYEPPSGEVSVTDLVQVHCPK